MLLLQANDQIRFYNSSTICIGLDFLFQLSHIINKIKLHFLKNYEDDNSSYKNVKLLEKCVSYSYLGLLQLYQSEIKSQK